MLPEMVLFCVHLLLDGNLVAEIDGGGRNVTCHCEPAIEVFDGDFGWCCHCDGLIDRSELRVGVEGRMS